jgi:hypothetical protein
MNLCACNFFFFLAALVKQSKRVLYKLPSSVCTSPSMIGSGRDLSFVLWFPSRLGRLVFHRPMMCRIDDLGMAMDLEMVFHP